MRGKTGQVRRHRYFSELSVFASLLLVSFIMILVSTRSFVVNIQDIGVTIFSGARSGVSAVVSFSTKTVDSIRELAVLKKEYGELVKRLEKYENIERDSADIKRENIRLKEQLGFSDVITYKHIAARIIGRDPDNLYSAFVIDKGSKQGIKRDTPVIAFQGGVQGLVGKIVNVGRSQSLVMPLYDSSSFVSSRFSESRYEGIVQGQGNADSPILMKYIKKRAKEDINFGDTIITSGMGGIFPPDIVIGRVSKILFKEYETSMEVELEPAIDFSRLEYVFAIDTNTGTGEQ